MDKSITAMIPTAMANMELMELTLAFYNWRKNYVEKKKKDDEEARNRFVKDHSSEVRKPIQSIEMLLSIIMTLILTCRCDRCLNSTSPRCRD